MKLTRQLEVSKGISLPFETLFLCNKEITSYYIKKPRGGAPRGLKVAAA